MILFLITNIPLFTFIMTQGGPCYLSLRVTTVDTRDMSLS